MPFIGRTDEESMAPSLRFEGPASRLDYAHV